MSQYVPTYDGFVDYGVDRYVPTQRFQVLSNVYLPSSDVDPQTGFLKPDRQRRCRTQGKRMEIERLENEERKLQSSIEREMSKGGVRISMRLGCLILAAIIVFCGFSLLLQQSIIVERQKDVNRLDRSISEYKISNAALETQIAEASSYAVICYAASQDLNMIPASSAEAIHLVAVDTRPMEHQTVAPQQELVTVDVTAQAAGVPVLASASKE